MIDVDKWVGFLNVLDPCFIRKDAPEGLNHVITRKWVHLISKLILQIIIIVVLREVLIELDCFDLTIRIEFIFNWSRVGEEVNAFLSCRVEDFIIRTQILETSSECNCDSLSTKTERRTSAIKSSVTNTEDNYVAVKFLSVDCFSWVWSFIWGFLDHWTDISKEVLWIMEVACLTSTFSTQCEFLWSSLRRSVRIRQTNTEEDSLESLRFKILEREVSSECLVVMNLDSELLNHFNFPKRFFNWSSVLRNFIWSDTTTSRTLFEDMDIRISHSSKERGTTQRGRASSNKSNRRIVRSR